MATRAETRVQMDKRVAYAQDCIKIQKGYSETVNAIVAEFKCSKRSAYLDMKRAYGALEGSDIKERPMRKHQLRETLRVILRKALTKGQLTAALRACREIAMIDGLYVPAKVEVGGIVGVQHEIKNMTSNDKRTELATLLAEYADRLDDDEAKGNGATNGSGLAH